MTPAVDIKIRILGPCLGGCGVILTMVGAGRPRKRCQRCAKEHIKEYTREYLKEYVRQQSF